MGSFAIVGNVTVRKAELLLLERWTRLESIEKRGVLRKRVDRVRKTEHFKDGGALSVR